MYVGGTTEKAVKYILQSAFGCQKPDSARFWVSKSVGASISADNKKPWGIEFTSQPISKVPAASRVAICTGDPPASIGITSEWFGHRCLISSLKSHVCAMLILRCYLITWCRFFRSGLLAITYRIRGIQLAGPLRQTLFVTTFCNIPTSFSSRHCERLQKRSALTIRTPLNKHDILHRFFSMRTFRDSKNANINTTRFLALL